MSVVVEVQAKSNEGAISSGRYCLVKGSPEAVFKLLGEGNAPAWYESSYNAMAEEGMRVLALAYKKVMAAHPPLPPFAHAEMVAL